MTKLEEIAAEIENALEHGGLEKIELWADGGGWKHIRSVSADLARAVLSALKTPTPGMIEAGAEVCDPGYSGKVAHNVWSAMIDAIK